MAVTYSVWCNLNYSGEFDNNEPHSTQFDGLYDLLKQSGFVEAKRNPDGSIKIETGKVYGLESRFLSVGEPLPKDILDKAEKIGYDICVPGATDLSQ